jgi:hypothetical protein
MYRYIKDPHRSEKRWCNCIYLTLNTFHISSTSILSANLPSLLDNKDTSPFKHESVTSLMLEAHLKCDNYKYYRSHTQNKTSFKCLGCLWAEVKILFKFLCGCILQYKFPTNVMYHCYNTKEPEDLTKIEITQE